MTHFFKKSQIINVSRMTSDGWWLENAQEHVSKGTALGQDFTQTLYTPSNDNMIARYDREHDLWSDEVENMTWKPYWNHHGQRSVIGSPDGNYPDWAIKDAPPEYDKETQTVLHTNEGGWQIYEILIGTPFYDQWGGELLVSDYNFSLPEGHTWKKPPEKKEGYAAKLIDNQWQQIIDNREKMAFAKDPNNAELSDYLVEELGALPMTHTLLERAPFSSWVSEDIGWAYDIECHRPIKEKEEKQWRDRALKEVLNRIDQYEKDQQYPEALRTSPINSDADLLKLIEDRKVLSDYPDTEHFPFGERPTLSGLAN
ncbi:hypothetical protein [Vibrio ostreicida]|uniref:hypothetical protein n=1 Tax=Vibrio ostreicida TaxID=526588 RepID=UPI0009710B03|nr:hypothetical protein [Vibrio ostreicida]